MRKFDKDGLILCEMQGQVFEMSIETTSTSSEIFIRRFMQSIIAKSLVEIFCRLIFNQKIFLKE